MRYFVSPLAILNINQTKIIENILINRTSLYFSLVLYTSTVQTIIAQHLDRCKGNLTCQIKMIPLNTTRVVWKHQTSSIVPDYRLDQSWKSDTLQHYTTYFTIECSTNETCNRLHANLQQYPQIFHAFYFEYTLLHSRKRIDIKITNDHVLGTKLYSRLRDMQLSPPHNHLSIRYLFRETMDDLVLQILNSAKLFNGCTDEREQLKKSIMEKLAIETEVLSEHSTVWDFVYWHNAYSSRPDRLIKTLNEYMLLWKSDEQHRSESYQPVTPAVGSLISHRRPSDDEDADGRIRFRRSFFLASMSNKRSPSNFSVLESSMMNMYKKNLDYIDFSDNKYSLKPIILYKMNLDSFQNETQVIYAKLTNNQQDSIYSVPIRFIDDKKF
ncbi:unnamed protein product [Didymodactylos carnosus]|uniref:Uncharacterized protein n=1 Tax=Didymodactylos carnosus TaxID=1234261 RepID=A0A814NWL0_9BILA|nr:unnamed protein product [Didymodactylos carnosus]CAF3863038.1 unnamed protein product [Didymodactylos carnosus]